MDRSFTDCITQDTDYCYLLTAFGATLLWFARPASVFVTLSRLFFTTIEICIIYTKILTYFSEFPINQVHDATISDVIPRTIPIFVLYDIHVQLFRNLVDFFCFFSCLPLQGGGVEYKCNMAFFKILMTRIKALLHLARAGFFRDRTNHKISNYI